MRSRSPTDRLLAASLIDWTGTGFYLAISAIYLTRQVGMTAGQVGLVLALVGLVAFAGSVHVGRLGDRFGHRELLCALHVVRALGFVALAAFPTLPVIVVALSVIGLADQGAGSITQALAGALVPREERVALMARLRVVTNIGITLGTVPAGIVLARHGDSFGVLLVANAASYLVAGAITASLPRAAGAAVVGRRRLLMPSAATTALITVDGLMSMWTVVLNIGLPLWILQATAASPGLVAILYGTNTVLAVLLQARISRTIGTYVRAAHAQRLAGLLLAACCGCLAASVLGGREASTAVLFAAVVCLTLAELLKASAAWQISFTLAPGQRSAEFFATYRLGAIAAQVCGPVLVTGFVLALGSAGWLLLAGVFLVGAMLTPPLARAAVARPLARRPNQTTPRGVSPRDHRRYPMRTALVLLAATTVVLAGCGAATPKAPPASLAASKHAKVKTHHGALGTYLVDGKGRTLYRFMKDTGRKSHCTGACADNWPPLTTREKPEAEGHAKASLLSTKRRKDGRKQVLYDGHPLYRFVGDQSPGDTAGQGLNAFGAQWFVVSTKGKAIRASAAPDPAPTSTPYPY
jgi:predicted lipoprotein with Yx(FWY)xxD motif/sugar phosphate permease